ncbi:MAG: carbohydrate-binding protein [Oscillospiraceae bacterium]|nr:carbohydrate-binding protein [Oscillospiraceae bacterium]
MKKRLLSIVLSAAMAAGMCGTGTAVTADDSAEQNEHRYRRFELSMTWDEADAYCKAQGGHLATVTSAGEQALIEDLLESGTKNHYWLGGQLSSRELTWITGETVEYTHWAGGQPDNYFGDEDSLVISREPVGSIIKPFDWHDLNRSGESDNSFRDLFGKENIGFICEWEGQEEQGTHRYQHFDLGMTWDEADAYCRAQGGHLATVTSAGEQALIEDLLESGSKNHYWLGGQLSSRELTWITGETVEYTHWAGGQPDNYFGDEDSLVISREPVGSIIKPFDWHDLNRSGESDNSFRDLFGTENIGFICEWEGTEETPQVTTEPPQVTTAAAPETTAAAATTTTAESTAAAVTTTSETTAAEVPAETTTEAVTTTALPAVRSAFETIEAETADQIYGLTVQEQAEDLTVLGYISNGNYAVYQNLDFGDGAQYFSMTANASASSASGGTAELHLDSADGKLIGSIDLKDVTVLRRHLAGGWNVIISEANSDVNRDGSIDLKDVTILRRYLAGGWGITL